ncbi:TRAP transporter substrate-binding protein [Alkalicoccus chagannorensis]|uniref:TRAP transporter substrate-binding protein n=1 Tax=Alkalicoccus chagannorensis TaxID=427072 RepID=UPI0004209711|nr:TRAP transporter substrate-binding protein [Alkalicoccus chagannorensis]
MKKALMISGISAMAVALAACGNDDNNGEANAGGDNNGNNGNNGSNEASGDDGETYTLSIGHTLAEASHYQEGLEEFKEIVEERSDGRLQIDIFADGALGGEREMIESLQMGDQEMVLTSTGPMSGFAEEVTVVDLPFLFENHDHAHTVLDGDIGQGLLDELEPHDLHGLAWWENGFRHVTNNNHPVEGPEDIDGLSLRTMENDIHMAAFEEMGGDPTPMSFTELFTSLQQGVVDGQENPIPVIHSSRFYEVQDHLSLTNHVYNPSIMMISQEVYDELPEDLQEILREEAQAGAENEREIVQRMEEEFIGDLEDEGMEVVQDVDLDPFIDAVQPVYEEYEDTFGADLIEEIQNYDY